MQFESERPRTLEANGYPDEIHYFESDKMSSEDGEWSDYEWFDEVATYIILDIIIICVKIVITWLI